jgi:rod shape-determining protein MreC
MTLDHRYHHLDSVRSGLSALVYPLRFVVNLPGQMLDWTSDTFTTRETLQEENQTLRTQNQLLKAELQKLTFLQVENQQLRALLDSSKAIGERVLIAELLSVDLDPYKRQIVINKGSRDDVYVGQPIIDASGVMGQVVHVGPFSSTALLITDPSHALPVQVNRNGLRAIAIGIGSENRIELPHLPNNADVLVGDLLVSSGLGCVFPTGYPVGRITQIDTDPSLPFAKIYVEPTARLNRSREVLLVWPEQSKRQESCSGQHQAVQSEKEEK